MIVAITVRTVQQTVASAQAELDQGPAPSGLLGQGVETDGHRSQRSKLAVAISQHDASNPVLFGSVQKPSGMSSSSP